jgi:hypothetical protein
MKKGSTITDGLALLLLALSPQSLNLDNGDPKTLFFSITRFFGLLSGGRMQTFLESILHKVS